MKKSNLPNPFIIFQVADHEPVFVVPRDGLYLISQYRGVQFKQLDLIVKDLAQKYPERKSWKRSLTYQLKKGDITLSLYIELARQLGYELVLERAKSRKRQLGQLVLVNNVPSDDKKGYGKDIPSTPWTAGTHLNDPMYAVSDGATASNGVKVDSIMPDLDSFDQDGSVDSVDLDYGEADDE